MRPIRNLSVLMPTWQGIEFLERVLTALAAQRCALPWDFLAIDSGSSDGTWELLGEFERRFPVPFARARIDGSRTDIWRNLSAAGLPVPTAWTSRKSAMHRCRRPLTRCKHLQIGCTAPLVPI